MASKIKLKHVAKITPLEPRLKISMNIIDNGMFTIAPKIDKYICHFNFPIALRKVICKSPYIRINTKSAKNMNKYGG
jgi:hypothetical protein